MSSRWIASGYVAQLDNIHSVCNASRQLLAKSGKWSLSGLGSPQRDRAASQVRQRVLNPLAPPFQVSDHHHLPFRSLDSASRIRRAPTLLVTSPNHAIQPNTNQPFPFARLIAVRIPQWISSTPCSSVTPGVNHPLSREQSWKQTGLYSPTTSIRRRSLATASSRKPISHHVHSRAQW
jgi:hypothetical protein